MKEKTVHDGKCLEVLELFKLKREKKYVNNISKRDMLKSIVVQLAR
jgi:hypothetical protein